MAEDFDRPCYVIGDKSVSYEDGWCYGKSRYLGRSGDYADDRALINEDARKAPGERNGLPVYLVSDHGNVSRVMRVRLTGAYLAVVRA